MGYYRDIIGALPDLLGGARNKSEWEERSNTIAELLCREEYGFPAPLVFNGASLTEDKSEAGYRVVRYVIGLKAAYGTHSFGLEVAVPNVGEPVPCILLIGFGKPVENDFVSQVTGAGLAFARFTYSDVTADNDDFNDGLAAAVYGGMPRNSDGCGKIMLWAQAAVICGDFISSEQDGILSCINAKRLAVVGHSRLGKTALVAGMISDRFAYVISNDSGCSGAAVTRGKRGEHINDITANFSYWFCDNYSKYAADTDSLPFDQHFHIAMSAPRHVFVGSANEDVWADPNAEYLGCLAASDVWKLYGLRGVEPLDRLPVVGDTLRGDICYHLRAGGHALMPEDMAEYIACIKGEPV